MTRHNQTFQVTKNKHENCKGIQTNKKAGHITNKILPSSNDKKLNDVGMLPIRPVEYKSITHNFLNDGNAFKIFKGCLVKSVV